MSANTPAHSSEHKPEVKAEGNANAGNNRHGGNQKRFHVKKKKFLGADPDLQGFVFESAGTRAQQITNFTTVDTRIKALVGQQNDPFVLKSLEKMTIALLDKLDVETIIEADANKKKALERRAKIKFKSKYDRWLNRTKKIEKEMKHIYSKYYGQCNKDIKATMAKDPKFEAAHQEKDVITLRKILQSVNFSYVSSEEPIKTMWQAKHDFIRLRQNKHQSVQEYYEQYIALKDVCNTLGVSVHDVIGAIKIIADEEERDMNNLTAADKKKLLEMGRERMMGLHFLMGSDHDRFAGAIEEFEHHYLFKRGNPYPKTLHDAHTLRKG